MKQFLHVALVRRLLLFVAGGLVSFLLNLLPYRLFTGVFHWPHNPAYATSLTFATVLMFAWNYRVNFPTAMHWQACAWRYLTTLAIAWSANFLLVGWLKNHLPVSGAIFFVGFMVALAKFGLYHIWIFPVKPASLEQH